MNKDNIGAFMTGVVVGSVTGAAVALLTVPQSGEDTRAQIVGKTNQIADQAKAELSNIQTQAVDAVNGVKNRAQTQVKDTVHHLADRTSDVLNSANKQVKNLEKEITHS